MVPYKAARNPLLSDNHPEPKDGAVIYRRELDKGR